MGLHRAGRAASAEHPRGARCWQALEAAGEGLGRCERGGSSLGLVSHLAGARMMTQLGKDECVGLGGSQATLGDRACAGGGRGAG